MLKTGRARVDSQIVDVSVLLSTGLKGIHAFMGVTERGEIGKTYLIGSWSEYVKNLGGLLQDSDFPLICKRALDDGAKLRISRVGHYTDPTDAGTLVGVKASGVIGTDPNDVTFTATSVGAWGNGITVTVAAAANGIANELDITVELAGAGSLTSIVRNVPNVLTSKSVSEFNAQNNLVKMDVANVGDTLSAGTVTLTLGAFDNSTVVTADYSGDSAAGTGIHAFSNDSDFIRISVPEIADPVLDIALAAYVDTRQDCRAILRAPFNISGATAVEYREGTGTYTHAPINTWRASMLFGGLRVVDPSTGLEKIVAGTGDVSAKMASKDNNQYEWFSAAGPKRGKIKNALGVDYNLASSARATEADSVAVHGLNPIINDPDYGVVYWGNNTLQKENTLLKHENVADLVIFIMRAVVPLAKSELFEPNDVSTWRAIYRKVNPLLRQIKANRGIWDYLYQGDQDVDKIEDAVVNDSANVDNGEYQFIIWLKPKVALKYIGIRVTVTNSGVNFEEISGEPV